MTKRSQLKSRFSWTNYKERWFALTRTSLFYYDGDDESKRKEKGRLGIKDVKLVEPVNLEDRPHSFQVSSSLNYFYACATFTQKLRADDYLNNPESL